MPFGTEELWWLLIHVTDKSMYCVHSVKICYFSTIPTIIWGTCTGVFFVALFVHCLSINAYVGLFSG